MNNSLEVNLDFGVTARLTVSDYGHAMLSVGRCGAVVIIIKDWIVSEWGYIAINSGSCVVFPETNDDLQAAARWLTDNVGDNGDSSSL